MAEKINMTVGQLNGWQVALFRVNLIFLPIIAGGVLALNVWLVTSQFETQAEVALVTQRVEQFISAGPRYTPKDAAALEATLKLEHMKMREEILSEVESNYPPQWLRDTVDSLSRRVEALEKRK